MNTQCVMGSARRKCSAWSSISDAVRLRPKRIEPVAQNVQVSGQPDCEERHTDRRPSRNRISTASTGWPSAVRKSALTVPSRARDSVTSSTDENAISSSSRRRRATGRSVISSYPRAPEAAQRQI
jgi:hypothetical protein